MGYDELAKLAQMCAINARMAKTKEVACELWKMAQEYQRRAADLDSGRLSDIGPPPDRL
jgi:hypothetical protein